MKRATVLTALFLAIMVGTALSFPTEDGSERVLHRVRRGRGYHGSLNGVTGVVDGSTVHAVSVGANSFTNGFQASQNFLSSAGGGNYLGQQSGLQAAAWAGGGAAAAGFGYDHTASKGAGFPSNIAGYQGGFELEVHIIPHPSDNTSSTMKRAATVFLLAMMIGAALSFSEVEEPERVLHRVRRGRGYHGSLGGVNTVVDGIALHAVSTGANNFVNGYRASQNFLASAGRGNYLAQQGGLQAAAWAASGAAAAGFQYNSVASKGAGYPSNVAGYQGFPSYGR
uniref:Uncharacterized protein n=1 Tax=Daphnia galeata TaxID=27404 RepID=A0A8J2WNP6_9CRUS|nr:unnamed protein product [Daphnia galeata]